MSRIPGTYEKGDRVRLRGSDVEGVVTYDNRKDGGRYVWVDWVHWDGGDAQCCDPNEIISVEAGR